MDVNQETLCSTDSRGWGLNAVAGSTPWPGATPPSPDPPGASWTPMPSTF